MKKLLGISLIAALAVSPMMARAEYTTNEGTTSWTAETPSRYNLDGSDVDDPVREQMSGIQTLTADTPIAEQGKYFKGKTVTEQDTKTMATGAYVKGAYNAAISAINKLGDDMITKEEVINTIENGAVETTTGILAYQDWDSANYTVLSEGTLAKGLEKVQVIQGAVDGNVIPNTNWAQNPMTPDTIAYNETANNAGTTPFNKEGGVNATTQLYEPASVGTVTGTSATDEQICGYQGGFWGTVNGTTQCWNATNCLAADGYTWTAADGDTPASCTYTQG